MYKRPAHPILARLERLRSQAALEKAQQPSLALEEMGKLTLFPF